MPSQLFVQVPVEYGDFWGGAFPGSPLSKIIGNRLAPVLLHLHLRMVFYSRDQRTEGILARPHIWFLARPAARRTADGYARQLTEAGFIERLNAWDYFIPAAVEWPVIRVGTRDPIPSLTRERVYERDGYRCVECGRADNLGLDHIIPWSLNGSDKEENLRTLCGSCNSRKGAKA